MTTKTTTRIVFMVVTTETITDTTPSSGPFRVARRIIDTTGEAVDELPAHSLSGARGAQVIPFRKAG